MSSNELQNRVRNSAPGSHTDSEAGVVRGPRCLRFQEVIGFLAWLESRHGTPRSILNRGRALDQFSAFLASKGVTSLQDVTPKTLAQYSAHLQERKLSPNTIETYIISVRRLYAWMADQCLVFENPAESLRPPLPPDSSPRVLSSAEVAHLVDAMSTRIRGGIKNRAILQVLYETGLTTREFLGLKVADVDLAQATIRVTTRQARVVPLTNSAAHVLRNYVGKVRPRILNPERPTDGLWLSRYRTPLSQESLLRILGRAAERAGIKPPVSVHLLRRSRASHLFQQGMTSREVANAFGLHEPAEWFGAIRANVTSPEADSEK